MIEDLGRACCRAMRPLSDRRQARPTSGGIARVSIHVVLVHPEIHWNTGNAGRTCLAAGATLHLIEPLGFSLEERQVRRAGLDYWEHVDRRVWPDWSAFAWELAVLEAAQNSSRQT